MLCFSYKVPSLSFLTDEITVTEGVNSFVYLQLRITDVPAGGLEGVVEYMLQFSPVGASVLMNCIYTI